MPTRRAAALAALLAPIAMHAVQGAPEAELWERWTAHDPSSTREIDHASWQRFLDAYVREGPDGVNRVAYGEVDASGERLLDGYLSALGAIPIGSYGRDEQLAYWMNLYNALTVKVILDHYPVESILDIDISPGLFSVGPWGKPLAAVQGVPLSLDDVEHRILRPIWKDPRVHYGVNCASIGCPELRARAFTAATVDEALEEAAREYVNSARGARFAGSKLEVSSIYDWFAIDFGGTDEAVIAHLAHYAAPELAARLAQAGRIAGDFYDWSLNEPEGVEHAPRERPGGARR